jgi:hypothetical protein
MGEIHTERKDGGGLMIQVCRGDVARGQPRGSHPGSGASSSSLKQAPGILGVPSRAFCACPEEG